MASKKLKLEIVSSMIKVKNIHVFCDFYLADQILPEERLTLVDLKQKATCLLQIYQKIMFKLNLLNISYAILEKELSFAEADFNLPLTPFFINKKFLSLKLAAENLKKQLPLLHFNNFELAFLGADEVLQAIV